mmetsp:Transcript_47555/g.116536  ORF Transcript_47555/g.116536 Transcript_47555/m.116536 type:complete len:654 (+) Transcript_47555:52-2013(+)
MAEELTTDSKAERARRRATLSPTGAVGGQEYTVPEGKRLEWTPSGQPFLVNEDGGEDEDSEAAMNEHKREKLSLFISFDEIERRFGVGTRIYWHFLVFIIVTNLMLGLFASSNYIYYLSTRSCENGCGRLGSSDIGAIHEAWCFQKSGEYLVKPGMFNESAPACTLGAATYDAVECAATTESVEGGGYVLPSHLVAALTREDPFQNPGFELNELYIAQYNEKHRLPWIITMSFCVLLTHLFGLCFWGFVQFKLRRGGFQTKSANSVDHDNPFAFSGLENAHVPGADRVTAFARTVRIFISYSIFIALVLISFAIVFGLEWANKADHIENENAVRLPLINFRLLDLAITLTITLINMFFSQISSRLTHFEKHKLWADHRRHHTMKLYSFKILNVSSMYFAIGAVPIKSACPYNDTGRKFLLLMFTDLIVQNSLELFMPFFRTKILARYIKRMRGKGSDEDDRPNFDIAEEFLELFYRQYVIYLGMSLFPLMPLFGAAVNFIEYPLDKFRMTKVCQKPKRLDITMKSFLAILLTITAVLALAMPPIGTGWVLAGIAPFQSAPDACPVFGKFRADQQPIASLCDPLLSTYCRCVRDGVNRTVIDNQGIDCDVFGPPLPTTVTANVTGNFTYYPPPINKTITTGDLAALCPPKTGFL